ncbi:MAG: DUF3450 domain-containing protein [Gammaproteobacteria bacterium]|nr:DUF3450 domain-containing protein [Gammaproteobacteria bacterium]
MNNSLPLVTAQACALILLTSVIHADPLQQSITATDKNNRQEQTSQQRIDSLGEQTRAMLEEYHALNRELDSLTVYNDQLQRLVQSQDEEQALIHRQMDDIELTQREIVPLMLRMIDSLESFVTSDIPFLQLERLQRVQLLRDLMDRSDVAVAEKYRRALEAYQIELDYSRTLEAYREELDLDGQDLTVDFLRLGRIGLYYQTLDGRTAAYWDQVAQAWIPLDTSGRLAVRRALRVANQQAAPELLELPISNGRSHADH